MALALWPCGRLFAAEAACRRALNIRVVGFPVAYKICSLGILFGIRGEISTSQRLLLSTLKLYKVARNVRSEGSTSMHICQNHIWLGQPAEALAFAEAAWKLAQSEQRERDLVRAARIRGIAELHLGDLIAAEHSLQHALNRARSVGFIQEELPILTALAELDRQRKRYDAARELLEQTWAPAERGPYPLCQADACNVLAQLERSLGHRSSAIEAAMAAYRFAWCDGPPYAYHYGLINARRHLSELGVLEPQLAPFDESKFPPMPDVDLNLRDEFDGEVAE